MKKVTLLSIYFVFTLSVYAQDFKSMDYGISLTPYLKDNLTISNATDNHLLYSKPVISGEIGIFFEIPFKYNLGLLLAAGIAYDPQNIGFKETEFQLPDNILISSSFNNTEYSFFNKYVLPISLFK